MVDGPSSRQEQENVREEKRAGEPGSQQHTAQFAREKINFSVSEEDNSQADEDEVNDQRNLRNTAAESQQVSS